ncbi:MAG: hypothetical protein Ct9H90mP25_2740 [Gammaproteobacteria bacterium]|nr:MAG: hypothetical protein Ct9H90mP25_2740 [Gammaproteobacteria bacterium]
MNTGEHVWMVANGDGPIDNPAIAHLNLEKLGVPGRPRPCYWILFLSVRA